MNTEFNEIDQDIIGKAYYTQFREWYADGNVIREVTTPLPVKIYYRTQDAQYRNRIESIQELYDYFVNEIYYGECYFQTNEYGTTINYINK
tara:strand:+ start:182 stop:454 length:273 start_codon:yes stop_codon:yes gene_type:complete